MLCSLSLGYTHCAEMDEALKGAIYKWHWLGKLGELQPRRWELGSQQRICRSVHIPHANVYTDCPNVFYVVQEVSWTAPGLTASPRNMKPCGFLSSETGAGMYRICWGFFLPVKLVSRPHYCPNDHRATAVRSSFHSRLGWWGTVVKSFCPLQG